MRIGIFTNVLACPPSGIGWHVIRLLEALAAIDSTNDYFLFYRTPLTHPHRQYFRPEAANFTNVPVPTPEIFYSRYFRVFDRWWMPRMIRRYRLNVFHGPNHYLPARGDAAQLVTYHDIAEAKLQLGTPGEQARQQRSIRRTLARADHVIALSECTRRDLSEYGIPPERVTVVYQGGNFDDVRLPEEELIQRTLSQFGIERPYILFIGSLVPRKNVGLLVRAYAQLRGMMEHPPRLVLGGADDHDEAERVRQLVRELGLEHAVTFTGYLDAEQVRGLYGGADLFALPSRYEGFGMIALEAMAYRLPVVSTRGGSLAEVIGDAGLLVEIEDQASFTRSMYRALNDSALREKLVARGLERLGRFRWADTARQTLKLYEQLAARQG